MKKNKLHTSKEKNIEAIFSNRLIRLNVFILIVLILSIPNSYAASSSEANVTKLIQNVIFKQPTINASLENSTSRNNADSVLGKIFNSSSVCINQTIGGCYWGTDSASTTNYVSWTKTGKVQAPWINKPSSAAVDAAAVNLSISFWVNLTNKADYNWLFYSRTATDAHGINVRWDSTEKMLIELFVDSTADGVLTLEMNGTPVNLWQNIIAIYNATANRAYLYINGTLLSEVDEQNSGFIATGTTFRMGNDDSGLPRAFLGVSQGFTIFNRSLNASEIALLSSKYYILPDNFTEAAAPPSAGPTTTITAKDSYDGSTINNFTAIITNGSTVYINSTTTGSIVFNNLSNFYNISINSTEGGGYFNLTFLNVNLSSNFEAMMYQAILYVNVSEIITNNPITNFLAKNPLNSNISNSTGWSKLFLKAGTYNISANASNYFEWQEFVNITNNQQKLFNISLGTGNYTIRAKSRISGLFIENFSILLEHEDTAYNYRIRLATKNYTIMGSNLSSVTFRILAGTYNLTADAPGYAIARTKQTILSGNYYPNYTFDLYTENSINFTIFDEFNKKRIGDGLTDNSSVFIDIAAPGVFSRNYSTINGSLYVDLLQPSDYRISYWSNRYTKRDYYLTVSNRSNQSLELYLLSTGNSTDTTLTINDETAKAVVNATIKMLRHYSDDNAYRIVAMSKTDQSGQSRINLEQYNAYYYFIIEDKNGNELLATNPSRIITTTLSYSVFVGEDVLKSQGALHKISHSLIFSNSSQKFSFTYNDAGNILNKACLTVEQITPQETREVCDTCLTSLSGTIECEINISLSGFFRGYGRIETTTKNSPYILEVLETASQSFVSNIERFGKFGAYLGTYSIMGLALLGTPYPYLSILLSLIALIFSAIMGIIGIEIIAITSLVIVGAIIIYRVRI